MVVPTHTHIYNLSEDVWPFITTLSPKAQAHEIRENTLLAGHEYLGIRAEYASQNTQFVTPTPIDQTFIDYIDRLIPGHTTFIHPTQHCGQLNQDLLASPKLLPLIAHSQTISAYCPSTPLFHLINKLKSFSSHPIPYDLPTIKSWHQVSKFGTKTGLRQLVDRLHLPQIQLAPGQIFAHLPAALNAAAAYPVDQGFVFKTQKGHAGMGVAIFPPHSLTGDQLARRHQIQTKLLKDNGYWSKFPLVVENYIPTDPSIGGGIPNVEGYIDSQGQVNLRYYCGLRILSNGTFAGTEIGQAVLPKTIIEKLSLFATTIGEVYAHAGYRGCFELDTLAAQDHQLYIAESNIRRNGGTHAYHVARYFFGDDFAYHHYLITHIVKFTSKPPSFNAILEKNHPLLFKPGGEIGLIPTDPDLLRQGQFGYMVLAETKKQAYALETKFLRALDLYS